MKYCHQVARLFSLIPLALSMLLLTAAPSATASTACPSIEERPFTLKEVAPGSYVRKGVHEVFKASNLNAIANIGFITGETSIAVIDTGGSYCDGSRFLSALRQVTKKPISHVINTHVHPDHTLGNAAFQGEGAIFIGHKNLPQAMRDKTAAYIENITRLTSPALMAGTKPVPPMELVSETLVIDLGGRKLTLTAHKTAHTDQDLTIFDQQTKILWAGDLLFHEHLPVLDGNLIGWQKVMDKLAALGAEKVIPGHGGPLLPWPKGMADQQRYLMALTSDLRRLINKGSTMLEAQKKAAMTEKERWKLFEEFNARNASAGFAELEWE